MGYFDEEPEKKKQANNSGNSANSSNSSNSGNSGNQSAQSGRSAQTLGDDVFSHNELFGNGAKNQPSKSVYDFRPLRQIYPNRDIEGSYIDKDDFTDEEQANIKAGTAYLNGVNAARNKVGAGTVLQGGDAGLDVNDAKTRNALSKNAYPAVDDASGSGGQTTTVSAPAPQKYTPKSYDDIIAQYEQALLRHAERNKPESDEEKAKRERREKWEKIISGISDIGRALGNLYFTTKYAPDMYDGKSNMSKITLAQHDKDKGVRDKRDNEYLTDLKLLYAMKKAQRDAEVAAELKKQELAIRQKAAEGTAALNTEKLNRYSLENKILQGKADLVDKAEAFQERVRNGEFNKKDKNGNDILDANGNKILDREKYLNEYGKTFSPEEQAEVEKTFTLGDNAKKTGEKIDKQTKYIGVPRSSGGHSGGRSGGGYSRSSRSSRSSRGGGYHGGGRSSADYSLTITNRGLDSGRGAKITIRDSRVLKDAVKMSAFKSNYLTSFTNPGYNPTFVRNLRRAKNGDKIRDVIIHFITTSNNEELIDGVLDILNSL